MKKSKTHSFGVRMTNISGYVLLLMFVLSLVSYSKGFGILYLEYGLYLATIALFTHLIAKELQ